MTRIAICGSGNRSRTVWQRLVRQHSGFKLVGVQDVNQSSLDQAVGLGNISAAQGYLELEQMLQQTQPEALLVCPVNEAHAAAIDAGLRAGCHILVEKPLTTELADAVRLTEMAEAKGLALAVVQNWRTKDVGRLLKRNIGEGMIGSVSHIFFRYLRDRELPHLPDYLFAESDPLLYAMGIHHFDLFRYILGQEIIKIEGHAFRPAWSRYQHPSGMQLWMETDGGVIISYVATFSSRNAHLPLESLQVEGELGTLSNESEYSEPPLWLSLRGAKSLVDLTSEVEVRDRAGQYDLADGAILNNFHAALDRGEPLISPSRENLGTLAMIEAARRCYREQRPINPQDLLSSYQAANFKTAKENK